MTRLNSVTDRNDVDVFFSTVLESMSLLSTSASPQADLVVARQFYQHVRDCGISDVSEITTDVAASFIMKPSRNGSRRVRPAESTQKGRRTGIRSVFRVARQIGFNVGDPTLDIAVDPLGSIDRHICISEEIEALRRGAPAGMCASGLPAILAFAEAGAANQEIRFLRGCDVELSSQVVTLPGTGSLRPRVNPLTKWGSEALRLRLSELAEPNLIVMSTMNKPSVSNGAVSNAFRQITVNAGLGLREFKVDSVRAWRAREIFAETDRIESVATFLGLKTLDGAARFIGHNWQVNL